MRVECLLIASVSVRITIEWVIGRVGPTILEKIRMGGGRGPSPWLIASIIPKESHYRTKIDNFTYSKTKLLLLLNDYTLKFDEINVKTRWKILKSDNIFDGHTLHTHKHNTIKTMGIEIK